MARFLAPCRPQEKPPEIPRITLETDLFLRRTQAWLGSRPLLSDSWCHSVFFEPFADSSNCTLVCIGRWVESVEDSDFAKQNDSDSAASPLAYLPTKLLKQGFNVSQRQRAAYQIGRRSSQGCAGASASIHYGTDSRYQMRLSLKGLLDTVNAQHQRRRAAPSTATGC